MSMGEVLSQNENIEAKEEWYNAFLEGTSRFPQGFFGNSIFMAKALLDEDSPETRKFQHARLSHKQKEHAAFIAESHHRKEGVTIGESEVARIQNNPHRPNSIGVENIWGGGKTNALGRIGKFAKILDPQAPQIFLYSHIAPELLEKLRQVLGVCVEALRTSEATDLSREYKTLRSKLNTEYARQVARPQLDAIKEKAHRLLFN